MTRLQLLAVAGIVSVPILTGCEEASVRNCPIIEADPSSNYYSLDYELLIPADCPVPLADPGNEEKYAAAEIWDFNGIDMEWAKVEVHNSSGTRVISKVVPFLVYEDLVGYAQPSASYTAATGKKTFDDYDIASFHAWRVSPVAAAKGRTKLTYQQTTLSTRVSGETVPLPSTSHTWSAPVSGGYPGFTYQWYRDSTVVGTGSSYTATVGSEDFGLRVEVTDQTWSKVAAVLAVNVGGVEASVTGPTVISEDEGASWTASARGGTGTYTFDWYLDDVWAGSGTQWGDYLSPGTYTLRADAQDTAGEYGTKTTIVWVQASCEDGMRTC